jgi:hypothetical protein
VKLSADERKRLAAAGLTLLPDGTLEPRSRFVTHDSGARAEFGSGMVRDTNNGKPRFDLIMPADLPYEEQMLTRWAALMARGARKYGDRNWERAQGQEELNRFRESAFRHFVEWYQDVRDGEDHAAAVFFNISAAEYALSRMSRQADGVTGQ